MHKERYEKGRTPQSKAKPARGGGNKPPRGSGERDASPSTTSTGSWIKCGRSGRRTISEWMEIDKKDPSLDWKRALSADQRDERYLGKPCRGDHDTTNPLGRHANQYKVSYKCVTCELMMLYIPRHGASGKYRSNGPLGKTVSKIDIEKITKERRPKLGLPVGQPRRPPIGRRQGPKRINSLEDNSILRSPWMQLHEARPRLVPHDRTARYMSGVVRGALPVGFAFAPAATHRVVQAFGWRARGPTPGRLPRAAQRCRENASPITAIATTQSRQLQTGMAPC